MKLQILALSTALLFGTGALAQTSQPNTPQGANNGNSTLPQPAGANGASGATQANPAENRPVNNGYGGYGGSWGWLGLIGLFGLFGVGRGRRVDTVRTEVPPTR